MTNHQIAVNPSPIATSNRCSREITEALCQKLDRAGKHNLREKIREGIGQFAAAIMVAAIMFGATYLFLVQLAEGGW